MRLKKIKYFVTAIFCLKSQCILCTSLYTLRCNTVYLYLYKYFTAALGIKVTHKDSSVDRIRTILLDVLATEVVCKVGSADM